jgi:hypothetical protein
MIVLDTNFLVLGLGPGSAHDARLRQWLNGGETLTVNVSVWAEFLCGPVAPDQARLASRLLPHPEVLLPRRTPSEARSCTTLQVGGAGAWPIA